MKNVLVLAISVLMLIACAENDSNPTKAPTPIVYTRLTQTIHQDVIAFCSGSGTIETSGLDKNDNLILENEEIDSVDTTCDVPVGGDDEDYDDGDFNCHKHNHGHNCKRGHK